MPDWVKTAWDEYAKRLPPDCCLELKEVKPESRTTGKTVTQIMAAEARRIESALPSGVLRLALDERGRDLSTVALSQQLEQWRIDGRNIVFLVGGPDGLDRTLKDSCASMIRLSSLTLPHFMVRIMLAEQLYRAWTVLTNHPYHRA